MSKADLFVDLAIGDLTPESESTHQVRIRTKEVPHGKEEAHCSADHFEAA